MRKITNRHRKAIQEGRLLLTKIDDIDIKHEFIKRLMCYDAIECNLPEDSGFKVFAFYRGVSIVEVIYTVGDSGFKCHVIQDKDRWHPAYIDEAFCYILQDVDRACMENGLLPLYDGDLDKGTITILLLRKKKRNTL